MLFSRNVDGTVTVDEWLTEQEFTHEFLMMAEPTLLSYCGEDIIITVANGKAHYKVTEWCPEMLLVKAVLLQGELTNA